MTKVLIVNSAEKGVIDFVEDLERILQDCAVNFQTIEYSECLTYNFSCVDGVIISGSPQGDDIVQSHQPYFQWLKTFAKPVMGICAGHHILGYMYGADYYYSKEPEKGKVNIEILKRDPIFEDLDQQFQAYEMHNDSISLPRDFVRLATSSTCEIQVMKHRKYPYYTFQFHPEYLNPVIFSNFIRIINHHKN